MKEGRENLSVEYRVSKLSDEVGDDFTNAEKTALAAYYRLRHIMGIAALLKLVDIQNSWVDEIIRQRLESLSLALNNLGGLIECRACGAFGDVMTFEELYKKQSQAFIDTLTAATSDKSE
jgi:hypothetical protein